MSANGYAQEVDAIKKDVSALRSDIAALTKSFKEEMKQSAGAARDTAGRHIAEGVQAARQAGTDAKEAASRQIESHPLTSVITAAGIGFVLGALLRR